MWLRSFSLGNFVFDPVQLLFTWNPSPLQSSKFSFEYLLLPSNTKLPKLESQKQIIDCLSNTCQVVVVILVMIRSLNKDYYNNLTSIGKAVYNLFLRFYMLSSSLNPVIYCFMSIQFRQQCKDFFKQIKCRRK